LHAHQTIESKNLTKKWTTGFQLGPINFSADPGETIAVFGRNGAGKSTFFQLLSGSLDRSEGDLKIFGAKMSPDAVDIRRRIGYFPQESLLPHWTTPAEILHYTARLFNLPSPEAKVEEQLKQWDALGWKDRPLCKASHGMQRRIGLAVSMIHDPDLLILDEPFNALDIINARHLELAIKSRSERGKTTLVSIHSPLIAAALCPRAVILEAGKLDELTGWPNHNLTDRVKLLDQRFFGAH
jgi:ABC-type multidrug transport system ATPase subunit